MAFESGVVPENWISAVIVPLYKGKLQRIECKNYRGISLLGVVGKMYARILKDLLIMSKMALLQGGVVDQIITLKKIGQKARKKKYRVYVGFIDLEKVYYRDNREALWKVLRMMIWG